MSDPAADPTYEEILGRLRERLVRAASARVGHADAQDVAQETLVLLTTKYAHVRAFDDLVPLSVTILRYKLGAGLRKSRRRGEDTAPVVDDTLPDGEPDPEEQAARRERLARLEDAIGRLGARCRQLLDLKLRGFSFSEIQQRLGAASLNTVYSWDHRCHQELRRLCADRRRA
jgi:RNA polymerase sigma-70 factor (ECF subfamily)